ncbi:MAG: ABC transporter permease [Deltaproteobacteria bacterium]|nr:ABC transporter permease [Deltaproteobacteria bacterium]
MGASSNLLYIFTDALRSLRENMVTTALTAVTLGVSLSIFSIFLFVFINLNAAINSWGDRTQIVAYIKDGSEAPDRIRQAVLGIPGVKSVEFVSKEKALKELKDELKGHEAILAGVDANPLPASVEIKVGDLYKNPGAVTAVVDRLRRMDWVEDVQFNRQWIEKVSALLGFVELAAVFMGVFLAAATVFIISNTIRLAVYARKEEIEIMRLVGASNRFIKIPFFIEGVVQGLIGGLVALLIIGAGRYLVAAKIPPYFSFVVEAPLPVPVIIVILIVSGVTMGVAGSLISMAKFLRV